MLDRRYWHRGLAREAVQPLLQYFFEDLGMHRVEATIVPENVAGIRFAEGLGFQRESGVLRDRLRVGDQYRDIVMYGLLGTTWRSIAAIEADRNRPALEAVAS